jgi:hypothetical protein
MNIKHPFSLSDLTIELSRGMCFGMCPVYTLTVSGDGKIEFFGESFVQLEGKHVSQISKEKVYQLYRYAQSIEYFRMKNNYTTGFETRFDENDYIHNDIVDITCVAQHHISVSVGEQVKKINYIEEFAPKNIGRFAALIDRTCESKILVGSIDD